MHINTINKLVELRDERVELIKFLGMCDGLTNYSVMIGGSNTPASLNNALRHSTKPVFVKALEENKAKLMLYGVTEFGELD